MQSKEFTGRKMLILTVSAFGVIIAVNLFMAYNAISTFPGLEVANSYVASQNFDKELKAQLALGWDVSARLEGGQLFISIRDDNGAPVKVREIGGILGRATETLEDSEPAFTFDGADYVAPVKLRRGNWNYRMTAVALDGTKFHQRIVLHVK